MTECVRLSWPMAAIVLALTAPRFVAESVKAYRGINGYAEDETA
jgi:hypothetical protein